MSVSKDYSELPMAIACAADRREDPGEFFQWRYLSDAAGKRLVLSIFRCSRPDTSAVEAAAVHALEVFILSERVLRLTADLAITLDFSDALGAVAEAGLALSEPDLRAASKANSVRCVGEIVAHGILPSGDGIEIDGPVAPEWVRAAPPAIRDLILSAMLDSEKERLRRRPSRRVEADDDGVPPARPSPNDDPN